METTPVTPAPRKKRIQNRDPATGQILKKLRSDIEDVAFVIEPPKPASTFNEPDKGFEEVRVWTGGPGTVQAKIVVPGLPGGIRPGHDFAYHVRNQKQYDALKRALGKRFWVDTIPVDETQKCDTCGWHCRSYAAMNFHLNHAHGRPQADG